jgi:hypothetical protein
MNAGAGAVQLDAEEVQRMRDDLLNLGDPL